MTNAPPPNNQEIIGSLTPRALLYVRFSTLVVSLVTQKQPHTENRSPGYIYAKSKHTGSGNTTVPLLLA